MGERQNKTARYKIISDAGGNRYRFFCDLSGLAVCTTKPIRADTEKEGLALAWETEGRQHFDRCHKCGRWVCGAMYNPDVCECVACAPWENLPSYCPHCGAKLPSGDLYCRECGVKLRYREVFA